VSPAGIYSAVILFQPFSSKIYKVWYCELNQSLPYGPSKEGVSD
jgi:hypothetical protein